MQQKIELLAPGGDVDAIKAAIAAGADAVYCGLDKFNARNRATNINFETLQGIVRLAHEHQCEIFITLNILIVESEIPAFVNLLNKLQTINIDGVILQDIGMFYLISKYYKSFKIHASTQMTTHNKGQMQFLQQLNAQRVNLSRELSLKEIGELASFGHQHKVLTEVFVHGSNCISFSGLCYMSSLHGGNSGNRGRCSQPCRDKYITTNVGKEYPLNLKDNSAFLSIDQLVDAGVASLKIEGRIKKFDYIYTVVDAYRKQIDNIYQKKSLKCDNSALYKAFNRDFSSDYLKGAISKDFYIDNPRDNSIKHLTDKLGDVSAESLERAHLNFYAEKDQMKSDVANIIQDLSIDKEALFLSVEGRAKSPLKVKVKGNTIAFEIESDEVLRTKGVQALNESVLLSRLKTIDDTAYCIQTIDLSALDDDLHLPFKSLTQLKNQLLKILDANWGITTAPVIPKLSSHASKETLATLSILIDSTEQLPEGFDDSVTVFYCLPNAISDNIEDLTTLLMQRRQLIPYFPAVLIGDDYKAAVKLLERLEPQLILSDNTGVAYEAKSRGIDWIAGPYLNITNSYSLVALKEEFNCSGAFISNELSRYQIKTINKPADFDLYYSMLHPIELMTSRQCLFHQVTGCHKSVMDNDCLPHCQKSSSIINSKQTRFIIDKKKGSYNKLYNTQYFLNTAIVNDLPNTFDYFSIDLRTLQNATMLKVTNIQLMESFQYLLNGSLDAEKKVLDSIESTTYQQYKKGI